MNSFASTALPRRPAQGLRWTLVAAAVVVAIALVGFAVLQSRTPTSTPRQAPATHLVKHGGGYVPPSRRCFAARQVPDRIDLTTSRCSSAH